MLIMKTLSKLNLLFAISVILWGCANDDNLREVLPVNSENTEESLYLGSCEAACALRSVIYVEKIGRVHMEC